MTNKELTPEEDFLENADIPNETLEQLEGQHFYSQSQVLWLLKERADKAVEEYKRNVHNNFGATKICRNCGMPKL